MSGEEADEVKNSKLGMEEKARANGVMLDFDDDDDEKIVARPTTPVASSKTEVSSPNLKKRVSTSTPKVKTGVDTAIKRTKSSPKVGVKQEDKDTQFLGESVSQALEKEYPKMKFLVPPSSPRPLYKWGEGVEPAYRVMRRHNQALKAEADAKYEAFVDEEMRKWKLLKLEYGDRKLPPNRKAPPQPTDLMFEPLHKWWVQAARLKPGEEIKVSWNYFEHKGLCFTPPYEPHNVPLIVKGEEVHLEPQAQELCNFLCGAAKSDYIKQETFLDNFWNGFMDVLPDNHIMKDKAHWGGALPKYEDCSFDGILNYIDEVKEKSKLDKKERPPILRSYDKVLKDTSEGPYSHAIVNGLREKLQQFKTEPPSLFRGRGEHPKRGTIKWRTFPENVTLNESRDAPVPMVDVLQMYGHGWGEVHHNPDVTWLAMYKDSVMQSQKYLFLGASSGLKGQSDYKKYQRARMLQNYIDKIRESYYSWMKSNDTQKKQLGLATYLIDRLALRAGNDKEEDEADTVGCCSLRAEHITLDDETTAVTFDFLGKDSIQYLNTVVIEALPYKVFKKLVYNKQPSDAIFDQITPGTLNKQLSDIAGFTLSAKMFRTYNASITLQQELNKLDEKIVEVSNCEELKAFYDRSNREVAILCNHQKAVPKTHGKTTDNIKKKIMDIEDDVLELEAYINHLKKNLKSKFKYESAFQREEDHVWVSCINPNAKLPSLERTLELRREKCVNMKRNLEMKEENKTVATGTSKMHYMDPRITVSFCKKYEIPIEKMFQATLIKKFPWAMNASSDFVW